MTPLTSATLALSMVLAAASLTAGPARADDANAYYPAGADGRSGPARNDPARNDPVWERPKSTQFQVMRCSVDAQIIDKVTLNRDSTSETKGAATYSDAAKGEGGQGGAGDWSLAGNRLKVSGDGFELVGDWSGALLTATITRPGERPARCRFQVNALRSFTQYQ